MRSSNSIWLFVIMVLFIPVSVFAIVNWYESRYQPLPVLGGDGHQIGEFRMVDQHGRSVSISHWNGKIVVANFFFSHCPVICPKMMKNLRTVQQEFQNDPAMLIQSFTVDPDRDSVQQLAQYASRFDINSEQWELLTGDKKEIYRLARKSFLVTATDGDGGPGDFIHSDRLVLIDGNKRIRGFYDGTSAAETRQLITDIKKIRKELKN